MESVCLFLSVRVWGQGFDEGKADNWPLVDQPKRKNKTIKTFSSVCFMLYENRWHFLQIGHTLVSHHF